MSQTSGNPMNESTLYVTRGTMGGVDQTMISEMDRALPTAKRQQDKADYERRKQDEEELKRQFEEEKQRQLD